MYWYTILNTSSSTWEVDAACRKLDSPRRIFFCYGGVGAQPLRRLINMSSFKQLYNLINLRMSADCSASRHLKSPCLQHVEIYIYIIYIYICVFWISYELWNYEESPQRKLTTARAWSWRKRCGQRGLRHFFAQQILLWFLLHGVASCCIVVIFSGVIQSTSRLILCSSFSEYIYIYK